MQRDHGEDLYELLQVSPKADQEIILAAYNSRVLSYHLQLNPSAEATALMSRLRNAYEVLSDPDRRAAYDRERATSYRALLRSVAVIGLLSILAAVVAVRSNLPPPYLGGDCPGCLLSGADLRNALFQLFGSTGLTFDADQFWQDTLGARPLNPVPGGG